jgi:peptidyl-prolyl cis-trans isomerase A (cyclophilin A)/peptidyl-prolyl cis-trans isomerase B (cyclophilin B)
MKKKNEIRPYGRPQGRESGAVPTSTVATLLSREGHASAKVSGRTPHCADQQADCLVGLPVGVLGPLRRKNLNNRKSVDEKCNGKTAGVRWVGIRGLLLMVAALLAATSLACQKNVGQQGNTSAPQPAVGHPVVVMETSLGTIKIELDADKAPKTVANFLRYVDEGFFDGTIFQRVIPGFMIQGGGFTPDMKEKPPHELIVNEAGNGLMNLRGTITMARGPAPNSASSQFFINVADNAFLNHKDETDAGFGYAVFGKVIEGMDVVDKIVSVKTTVNPIMPTENSAPVETVIIKSVKRQ